MSALIALKRAFRLSRTFAAASVGKLSAQSSRGLQGLAVHECRNHLYKNVVKNNHDSKPRSFSFLKITGLLLEKKNIVDCVA